MALYTPFGESRYQCTEIAPGGQSWRCTHFLGNADINVQKLRQAAKDGAVLYTPFVESRCQCTEIAPGGQRWRSQLRWGQLHGRRSSRPPGQTGLAGPDQAESNTFT